MARDIGRQHGVGRDDGLADERDAFTRDDTIRPDRITSGRESDRARLVSAHGNYAEAERAVDYLADHEFPVEHVTIAGRGLRSVEQVTGRRTWVTALADGAVSGALVGMLFGFVFGLFDVVQPLVSGIALALWGLLFGTVIGALVGMGFHVARTGTRDFSSVSRLEADRYDVLVDAPLADEAVRLLRQMPLRGARNARRPS